MTTITLRLDDGNGTQLGVDVAGARLSTRWSGSLVEAQPVTPEYQLDTEPRSFEATMMDGPMVGATSSVVITGTEVTGSPFVADA